jgi:outer membrane lipoprotein-sorting protein
MQIRCSSHKFSLKVLTLLGAALAVQFGKAPVASASNADDLLRTVDGIRAPGNDFSFDVKLTYYPRNKRSVEQEFRVAVRDAVKSLVKFVAPSENRGRVLLMVKQNMWIYMPNVNQPVRISPQQRLLGQVANGDVARVVYHYDYSAQSMNPEKLNGDDCNKLELTAKTDDATYGKIVLWVDADNSRPRKAQFYASTGKLLKTAYYQGYEQVMGKQRPMTTVIEDELHDGEKTIMQWSNFRSETLPDSQFRKDSLKYLH